RDEVDTELVAQGIERVDGGVALRSRVVVQVQDARALDVHYAHGGAGAHLRVDSAGSDDLRNALTDRRHEPVLIDDDHALVGAVPGHRLRCSARDRYRGVRSGQIGRASW